MRGTSAPAGWSCASAEKAKADYIKARKIVEAEGIDAELVASAPKAVRTQKKKEPPFDKISGQWQIAIGERQYEADKIRTLNVRLDNGGGSSMPCMGWRKSGENNYTLIFPNGGTAKVRLGRGRAVRRADDRRQAPRQPQDLTGAGRTSSAPRRYIGTFTERTKWFPLPLAFSSAARASASALLG